MRDRDAGAERLPRETSSGRHRLRAVVASYKPGLEAFTLIAAPEDLMALCAAPADRRVECDPRAQNHLDRLRDDVRRSGLPLPGAIVVAVAGGRMRCECDHLYALELDPCAGDRLIVLEGEERLAELARGERGHCQTFVSAVLWRTALQGADAAVAVADAMAIHGRAAARWACAARVWH